jgi:hypothetical protein
MVRLDKVSLDKVRLSYVRVRLGTVIVRVWLGKVRLS